MKQKKVAALLLTMALCAGMAVPQAVVPFGIEAAFAAETESSVDAVLQENYNAEHKDQNYPDSDTLWQVYCVDAASLSSALNNASTDAERPTYIWITDNIDLELKATTYLDIKKNSQVLISSVPEAKENYYIRSNIASTQTNNKNSIFNIQESAAVDFSNIVIDGNHHRRCISIYGKNSTVNLRDGAIIQNGGNTTTGSVNGLGIGCTTSSSNLVCTVNVYAGAKITGCNSSSSKSVQGKAIFLGKMGNQLNIFGGEICNNDDVFDETVNYTSKKAYGGKGAVYCAQINMTGGSIHDNKSLGVGGLYLTSPKSSESVIGGEAQIYNNTVNTSTADKALTATVGNNMLHTTEAGGIYKSGVGTLLIQGNAKIYSNKIEGNPEKPTATNLLSGGGMTVDGGTVKMSGGQISDNTTQSTLESASKEEYKNMDVANGGGVYIKSGSFEMSDGSIEGNKATAADQKNTQAGNGGGVYVAVDGTASTTTGTGATFSMTGGVIRNNTASKGKDLYVSNYLKCLKGTSANGVTNYEPVDVAGTPTVSVGGKVTIGDIYLPASSDVTGKAELTVTESLKESNIDGITPEKPDINTVIANAALGYDGLFTDAQAFKIKDAKTMKESATIQAEYDGDTRKIVLTEKALSSESIAKADIGAITEYTYDGNEKKPQPTVTLNGVQLVKGEFSYSYMNNKNAGTATVIVNGNSPYADWTLKDFVIKPLSIADKSVQAETLEDRYFTGEEIVPDDVNITFNGTKLEKDKDYTLACKNNTNAGTATVIISGKGNFTGERELTFEIKEPEDEVIKIKDGAALKRSIESLDGTDTSKDNPAKYILTKNIVVSDGIRVPYGQYVEIYGNHMTMSSGKDNFVTAGEDETADPKGMFIVGTGSSLTLSDKMTVDGKYQERLVYVCKDGTFNAGKNVTMTGGRVTDQDADLSIYGGQCIYNLGETTFAGTISDNVTKKNSYGAIYNNGTFKMAETALLKNITVKAYGAFYNDADGKVTMNGGTISETACEQTFDTRNAKAIFNLGTFVMNGGAVKENEGQYAAILNCKTFIMNGGSIADNKNDFKTQGAGGDGTILQRKYNSESADPTFLMTGGEISGNESMYRGGAIFVDAGIFTVDGDTAVIKNNTVASKGNEDNLGLKVLNNGGAVFIQGGTFELKKGSIEGNQAYLKTQNETQKQAFNGGTWYYNSNGTPSDTSSQGIGSGSGSDKHYGLGAAVYVNGGILKLSGGNVSGNVSAPLDKDETQSAFQAASGVYVADGNVEMSGAPAISDVIYLEQGKNIKVTGKLTGSAPYTVYQTENDLKLKEDVAAAVGKAVATYKADSDAYQATDGSLFKLYAYDEKYDYAADKTLTHYTAFADGIYADRPVLDLNDLDYIFIESRRFNGIAVNSGMLNLSATAQYKDAEGKELGTVSGIKAGNGLNISVQENTGAVGKYTVTVEPGSDARGYHYTGSKELMVEVLPYDLSETVYVTDADGKELYYDENGNETDAFSGTRKENSNYLKEYSFADKITYQADDAADKAYRPELKIQARLGVLAWTDLAEGTDYEVTYENNTSGSKKNITATITGIGNYSGILAEDVDTGIKVKDIQTITASDSDVTMMVGTDGSALKASSSDASAKLTYVSSAPDVATVDANGQVTPHGMGTTQITVTAGETDTSRPAQKVITVTVEANPELEKQEADKAAADNVTRLVNNLNTDGMTVDNLTTSKTSVNHARNAYEALTDDQKKLVTGETVEKLTAAEDLIKALEVQAEEIAKQKADQKAAADVEESINALPLPADITAEKYADQIGAITEANSQYDTLTDAQKALVSDEAKQKLAAVNGQAEAVAEAIGQDQADTAKAQAVSDQIAKMPKAPEISKQTIAEDEAAVKAARAAYDALTDAQKAKVPQAAVNALTQAEQKIADVKKAIEDSENTGITEISIMPADKDVTPVESSDGSKGLALDLDEKGRIVIMPGDETHPVLDAVNKKIDNTYIFDTAVAEINQSGEVISPDLDVAEVFNIDWYVGNEKKEFDDSILVKFPVDGVKATDIQVIVLHQHGGKWTQLDVHEYGDGWVQAQFDGFSPAIVLVAHSAAEDPDNTGGGNSSGSDSGNNGGSDSGNGGNGSNSGSNSGGSTDSGSGSGNDTGSGSENNTGDNGSGSGSDNGSGTGTETTHVHKLIPVAAVAATGTTHGNIAYYKCEECGKLFSDANGEHEISQDETIEHNWGQWTITKAATATEAGTQERTCTVCGEKEVKEIPAGTNMATYNPNAGTTATGTTWNGTNGVNGTTAANTAAGTTAASNGVNTPKTGDRANMPATYATLLAALAALFGVGISGRRRREEEKEKQHE